MIRYSVNKYWAGIYLFFLIFFLAGCKRHKDIVFSGWVVDQQGQAIADALVKINDDNVRTAKDGRFELGVNSKEKYFISVKHKDHADLYRNSRSVLKDQVYVLPGASVKVVDPTAAVTLVDERPVIDGIIRAGATFTLPPNALVKRREVA